MMNMTPQMIKTRKRNYMAQKQHMMKMGQMPDSSPGEVDTMIEAGRRRRKALEGVQSVNKRRLLAEVAYGWTF